ncbi:unnamed protein product [Rotaria magnacalcarata]|uniref:Oxysterol-binding protein n=2 Tax=Rotaria magnacalcarata TaxID=392030 RepID=A0A816H5P4_9BILA|nr:unnamed protein product [Rotaria magnacalcarata]CAF1683452.1 unnamed protein product [Rotaria magnacalcarata]CAF2049780.1 unnamed protein product [Rotaria magnacalcarata]
MASDSGADDTDEFFDAEDINQYVVDIHRDLVKSWNNISKKKYGRTKLPAQTVDRSQIGVWSMLKQCIGKELYKMTMPVVFNEPLSMLQRFAECVQYAYLLDKADESTDPIVRMQCVAAFAASTFASNLDRIAKPFNPLLGETYEFVHHDLPFRYTSEQVSHHPPVTAFICEPKDGGNQWKYYGSILPDAKFSMTAMQIDPKGSLVLELNRHKETYTWSSVTCTVHNIVIGKLWFEYHGTMEIINHSNKMKAIIHFKPYSSATKELHKLEGYIIGSDDRKLRGLYGYWTDALFSIDIEQFEAFLKQQQKDGKSAVKTPQEQLAKSTAAIDIDNIEEEEVPVVDPTHELLNLPADSITLWRTTPRLDYAAQYYNFSLFTMALNEWTEKDKRLRPRLPPTDCRFRPDIRRLEEGNIDQAAQEKNRLEEKQRAARRALESRQEKWQPRWFSLVKHQVTGNEIWLSNDKYWQRNWNNCPDIY